MSYSVLVVRDKLSFIVLVTYMNPWYYNSKYSTLNHMLTLREQCFFLSDVILSQRDIGLREISEQYTLLSFVPSF